MVCHMNIKDQYKNYLAEYNLYNNITTRLADEISKEIDAEILKTLIDLTSSKKYNEDKRAI